MGCFGCFGSKAVSVAAPEAPQQSDGSSKPWKKNQVVPLPHLVPAEGSASKSSKPPPSAGIAFAGNGKDAGPDDQAPVDAFVELRSICSGKVDGARLANLAERLSTSLKHHLPASLRAHVQPKDVAVLTEVAQRAVECCSSTLQPVLSHINRILSNQQASSSWSESTTWEQVEFADFLGMLESACNSTYDQGVMEVGRPVALLMEILHELRQHSDANGLPLPASATRVPALDELMSMLGIIYFRKVVLETAEAAQSKLEQYQQLQEQIGWSDTQLATCTGPEARAMLLYLHQVSSSGEKRLNVTVRRSAAFWDAFECARRDGLLPSSSGPMCHKYFPSFVDEYASEQASTVASPGGRKPAVEAGEGHGPRKEFFQLAGQDMAGQQSRPPVDASTSQRSGSGSQDGRGAPGTSQASGSSGRDRHRRPALWVFNRTAGAYWYNTQLQETPELKGAYAFAGWLLGQSLLNRAPLGLPLPAVLFRALLEGPPGPDGTGGFQPTLQALEEFDPDAAAGLRNAAALPPHQLTGLLELEGLPADWSAERYVQHAVAQVLRDGVAWQSAAVSAGFFAALDRRLLRAWQLGPAALAALAAGGAGGEPPADLSSLFRLALDEELSGHSSLLVELLWEVLAGWPAERRLRFVEFVTGTSRLPLPGSELLKIQAPFVAMGAAEHKATLGMLPQAHTCDNLLELPNYWESLLAVRGVRGGPAALSRGQVTLPEGQLAELRAEARRVLNERLELAVLNFQGYGLDERSGAGGFDDDGFEDGPAGRKLNPPEPSAEPDIPLTPAALTADSLASLARLSAASSSMLHASHPLAFSAAAAAAVASPPIAQRNQRIPHYPLRDSATAATATVSMVAAGAPQSPVVSQPARLSGNGAPQRLALGADTPVMSEAERQATLLARFDIDLNDRGVRSSGGAPYPPPAGKRESTSEGSHDAFK